MQYASVASGRGHDQRDCADELEPDEEAGLPSASHGQAVATGEPQFRQVGQVGGNLKEYPGTLRRSIHHHAVEHRATEGDLRRRHHPGAVRPPRVRSGSQPRTRAAGIPDI